MDFTGRTVVITGASRGFGRALAECFAKQGAQLGLLARDGTALADLAAALPTHTVAVSCDVTDADAVSDAFERIAARFEGIDAVVANAGVTLGNKRAQNLPVDVWRKVIDVNLTGAYLTARAAHPYLARSRSARLVLVSSCMARTPRHGVSAYAVSKAGVEGLAKALAVDWAADSITVNAVAPGFLNVGMGAVVDQNERYREQVLVRTPASRLGDVHEVVDTVLFLAGEAASYITGHTLAVDGGYGLD
ncbi:MAG TPA: SDR family NAD(P)-dependent oxidoreductase [Actinophytocola sp.]|jgi:NAD(P)-dependent dehydrogenase (short-subunit alcohol dehydrogenase family)|uniref:SDR family NAD(P)-dependent oxidoreductase n=1 Tax=Actinophytocola sp. TaxID=1872138 RepID=UPI002F94B1D7